MKASPLISVITVVYNDKVGFEQTAKSVISQTAYSKIEWIVIDGNSNDGTKDIIYKHRDYISHTISEPDNGIYDAMNKGISLVQGLYCIFMNAGDLFSNDTVIEDVIKEPFFGKADYISGNTYLTKKGVIVEKIKSPTEITGKYFYTNSLNHQSTLIRSQRLKNVGGYDTNYKLVADAKFFFEDIIIRNRIYCKTNIYIAKYDIEGISSTKYYLVAEEREQFLQTLIPPRINTDYKRFVNGGTILERILIKTDEQSIIYKAITLLAIILYSPIAIKGRLHLKFKRKRKIRNKKLIHK